MKTVFQLRLKEVLAKEKALQIFLTSPQRESSNAGQDWQEITRDIQRAKSRLGDLELSDPYGYGGEVSVPDDPTQPIEEAIVNDEQNEEDEEDRESMSIIARALGVDRRNR